MIKEVLLSIFIILLIFNFISAECIDSDGGKDYYTFGKLNYNINKTSKDSCIVKDEETYIFVESCIDSDSNKCYLIEKFCNEFGEADQEVIRCSNGCEDNVCLKGDKTCEEDWECSPWSGCEADKQRRTCSDKNDCGTEINKPVIVQDCNINNNNEINYTDEETESFPIVKIILIAVFLIVIIIIGIFLIKTIMDFFKKPETDNSNNSKNPKDSSK